MTTSKDTRRWMEMWGLNRWHAYTDFTRSLTGRSFLPSQHGWHLPTAAAHFSFGNHSLSVHIVQMRVTPFTSQTVAHLHNLPSGHWGCFRDEHVIQARSKRTIVGLPNEKTRGWSGTSGIVRSRCSCTVISHLSFSEFSICFLLCWPSSSHPSRLIQNSCLSFLRHTANSHWLSI